MRARRGGSTGLRVVLCAVLVLAVVSVARPSHADTPAPGRRLVWMTADEVRALLVGEPAAGVYPDGNAWAETMHPGGRTDYTEKGERKQGDWYFSPAGELCFRYDYGKGGGCFRYVRLGSNCFEHFSALSPRGEPPGEGPGARHVTNGKLWRTREPATCDERPSV